MKELLSNKNSKLGKLASFSLPLSTCDREQCKECSKYCYAKKLFRMYPQYAPKMLYNLEATKESNFSDRISMELNESARHVRIHVSGDFYSQEYLNHWFDIAKRNPEHVFYCYTKALNLDFSNRPSNFIAYLSDDQRRLDAQHSRFDGVTCISFDKQPIPGYTLCPNQDTGIHCAQCKMCMQKGNKIYFKKH